MGTPEKKIAEGCGHILDCVLCTEGGKKQQRWVKRTFHLQSEVLRCEEMPSLRLPVPFYFSPLVQICGDCL